VKESPIIFSTEMVRAILEGGKTQTRRVVKIPEGGRLKSGTEYCPPNDTHNGGVCVCFDQSGLADFKMLPCPYGQVGDRLWVRETWQYHDWTEDGEPFVGYRADGAVVLPENVSEEWCDRLEGIWARLSVPENYDIDNRAADRRWRPSIHMPRWASRITLEIVKVRVERLQEITYEDYLAEGMTRLVGNWDMVFRNVWNQFTPKHPWESNPWVWVIEFRLLGK